MSEYVSNLIDGLFGLVIVGGFILFIAAKIAGKGMGELMSLIIAWISGDRKKEVKPTQFKQQIWQPKTMT